MDHRPVQWLIRFQVVHFSVLLDCFDPSAQSPLRQMTCVRNTFKLMSFFLSTLQSRLTSLLLGILFLCTAVLALCCWVPAPGGLAGWSAPSAALNQALQSCPSGWLKRHPKTISATLLRVLVGRRRRRIRHCQFGA
jgi:hypothetical protein